MKVEEALSLLPSACKAKRLSSLWPTIEAKLAEGVPHAEVLGLLNRSGFDLKQCTYKTYLYRYRKKLRQEASAGRKKAPASQRAASSRLTAPPDAGAVDSGRPPTFDYDPRGIPDLLK
jgi:hypothetical protein